MPELNHKFTLGRMNKDADERLVGNGEYRDALNVQVATSDGSDMGTLQNLLGNTDVSADFINFDTTGAQLGDFEYQCVGSIVDGKTDRIYWLLAGTGKDVIAEYDYNTGVVSPVVIDIFNSNIVAEAGSGRVLNFDKNFLITGINIVEDFLFWTDNNTEPKQLSIKRSKLGCIDPAVNAPSFSYASDLYVKTRDQQHPTPPFINVGKLKEEHITVVKKSPKTAPRLEMKNTTRADVDSDGVVGNIISTLTIDDPVEMLLDSDGNWLDGAVDFATDSLVDFTKGDFLVLELNQEAVPLQEVSEIVLEITGSVRYHTDASNIPVSLSTMPTTAVPGVSVGVWFRASIVSGNLHVSSTTNLFTVKLKQKQSLFKFKFPRFAYRYKYTDGQHSTFSPFSEVAFLPSEFDYLPKEGYNLGMVNSVRKLAVKDFVNKKLIPDDVVEIDILYKESNSPVVYTVDTIKRVVVESGTWDVWNGVDVNNTSTQNTTGFLNITSEVIHAVVPANQMLRGWDNVPRKALAQEIVGNRIVYGNYLQNYNLYNNNRVRATALLPYGPSAAILPRSSNISVDVKLSHKSNPISTSSAMVPELLNPFTANFYSPAKSIKSLRTYQVGVSYIDEFGRETPVFSSAKGGGSSLQIDKSTAHEAGKLKAQLFSTPPQWAKNFKFLIKESSNEYYNLAMDRWYPAQDGNIWLSFPSAERNKVNDETFLILKKRHDSDIHVSDNTKYKILAIENEAPLFIKTKRVLQKTIFDTQLSIPYNGTMTNVIGTAAAGSNDKFTGFPQPTGTNIIFDETTVASLTTAIEDKGMTNWEFRVRHAIGGTSNWYGIQSYELDPITENIKLVSKKIFGIDMSVTSPVSWDDLASAKAAAFGDIQVEFARREVEDLPEFDGRFFVKVLSDSAIQKAIVGATVTGSTEWQVTNAIRSQYINAEPQYGARDVNDWEDDNSGSSKFFGENEDYISISEHALGGHSSAVKYHDIHNVTGGGSGAGGGQSYWGMAANTTNTSSSSSGWFIDKIEAFRPWKSTGTMGWNYGGNMDNSYTLNYATGDYTMWMKGAAGTATSGHQKQLKLTGTGTHSTITSAQNYLNIDANSAQKAVPPSSGGVPHLQSRTTYDYGGITPSKGIDKTDNIIHLSYAGVGNDHSPTGSQGLNSLSQLKTHFDDAAWANSYVDEIDFVTKITTPGSLWRWGEDPDQIVYRTTGWDASMAMTQAEWNRNYEDSVDHFRGVSLYNYTQFSDYLVKYTKKYEAWTIFNGYYTCNPGVHHSHFVSAGKANPPLNSNQYGGFGIFLLNSTPPARLAEAVSQLGQISTCHGEGLGAPQPHWKWPQFTEDYSKAKNKRRRYQFAAAPFIDGNGEIVDDAASGYSSTLGRVWNNDGTNTGNYLPTNDPNLESHFNAATSKRLTALSTTTPDYNDAVDSTPPRPATDAPGIRPDGVYTGYKTVSGDIPALKTVDDTLVQSMASGSCTFQILEPYVESGDEDGFTTTNPAIWETEPREDLDLDLYHEVGQIYPVELNETNMEQFTGPIRDNKDLNTKVTCLMPPWGGNPPAIINLTTGITYTVSQATALGDPTLAGSIIPGSDDIRVVSHEQPEIDFKCFDPGGLATGHGNEANCRFVMDVVTGLPTTTTTGNTWESTDLGSTHSVWLEDINGVPLVGDTATMSNWPLQVAPPYKSTLIFTREDGSTTQSSVGIQAQEVGWGQVISSSGTLVNVSPVLLNSYEIEEDVHNYEVGLPWHNCYSFGNGVESNRIRDDYNQVFIDKGAKVSTVLSEPYLEDRRSSGLIYSGIYNSMSNVNNLNQFIQAEKITKDLNPDGGSIQKLHTRNTNLITICEDKVFKILANKDALYNADGRPQLIATDRVLGEATAFAGNYGISTNPESFAVDSFRMYFTDRVRGAVIRLSQDGITPISSIGMTDWFDNNLVQAKRLVGSFDEKKKEYNLNLGYFDYTTYSVGILVSKAGQAPTLSGMGGSGGPPPPVVPPVYTVVPPGILIINGADASNFSIGDIVKGQGIPLGSVITAIDYQGGGEWIIKLNKTPDINDLWALLPVGETRPYSYGETAQVGQQGAPTNHTFPTRITASKETQPSNTISFSEKNKGWVSFKSFLKEDGVSLNNEYFTFKYGMLHQHHENPIFNNFYGQQFDSSVEVLFNELPGSVKSFGSLSYEGSQSHITQDLQNSSEYWDNKNKLGWYVNEMHTNLQQGDLHEFKDKEDKWFSQIKGTTTKWLDDGMGGNIDTNEFSYQGIDDNSGVSIIKGGYTSWDCGLAGSQYTYPCCNGRADIIDPSTGMILQGQDLFWDNPSLPLTGIYNDINGNPGTNCTGHQGHLQGLGANFGNGNNTNNWIGFNDVNSFGGVVTGAVDRIESSTSPGAEAFYNTVGTYVDDNGFTGRVFYADVTDINSYVQWYHDNVDDSGVFYLGMSRSDFGSALLAPSIGVPFTDYVPMLHNPSSYDACGPIIRNPLLKHTCIEVPGLSGAYATESMCLADAGSPCGSLCDYKMSFSHTVMAATDLDCTNGSVHVSVPTLGTSAAFWNVSYTAIAAPPLTAGTTLADPVAYLFAGDSNSYTLPSGKWLATVTDANGCDSTGFLDVDCNYIAPVNCASSFNSTINVSDATEDGVGNCPATLADGSIDIAITSISPGASTWSVEYFQLVSGILTSVFIDDNLGNGYYTTDSSNLGSLTSGDYVLRISDNAGCVLDYSVAVLCVSPPVVVCIPQDRYDFTNPVSVQPTSPNCNNGVISWDLAISPIYSSLGAPLPTTVTVTFHESSTPNIPITTTSYAYAQLPLTITNTGLSAGVGYGYTINDDNNCSTGRSWSAYTCYTPQSWDCDGQGNCSDPGTGLGQYSTLSSCTAACPAWWAGCACDVAALAIPVSYNNEVQWARKLMQHAPIVYDQHWGVGNPVTTGGNYSQSGITGDVMNPNWQSMGNLPSCYTTEWSNVYLAWANFYAHNITGFPITTMPEIAEMRKLEQLVLNNQPVASLDLRCQNYKFRTLYAEDTEIIEIWMPWNLGYNTCGICGIVQMQIGHTATYASANPGAVLVIHCAHPAPDPFNPTTADRTARVQALIDASPGANPGMGSAQLNAMYPNEYPSKIDVGGGQWAAIAYTLVP